MSQARNEPETAEVDRLLTAAARVIAGVRYCWLVTEAGTGLNARPMGHLAAPNHEWNIRFVTDGRSRKASEMRRARKVALIFQSDQGDAYVALNGRATLIEDEAEVRWLWKRAYDPYFPNETDKANAAFVQVGVERMELWIRGVTPEPFGLRATRLDRGSAGDWRLSDNMAA